MTKDVANIIIAVFPLLNCPPRQFDATVEEFILVLNESSKH